MSKIVLVGFAAAWFFAASPTNRSSSVKATYEGVIRCPGRKRVSMVMTETGATTIQKERLTLVIDKNLNLAMLHDTHAAVCSSKILES